MMDMSQKLEDTLGSGKIKSPGRSEAQSESSRMNENRAQMASSFEQLFMQSPKEN